MISARNIPPRGNDPVDDATMFAVSYLDRQGTASGFGVVAHRDCSVGLSIAERVVRRWAEALRSRRLLVANTAPLCWEGSAPSK